MLLLSTMLRASRFGNKALVNILLQVVKGLRGGVQDVALKMLIGETHFQVNSFRQVHWVLLLSHLTLPSQVPCMLLGFQPQARSTWSMTWDLL